MKENENDHREILIRLTCAIAANPSRYLESAQPAWVQAKIIFEDMMCDESSYGLVMRGERDRGLQPDPVFNAREHDMEMITDRLSMGEQTTKHKYRGIPGMGRYERFCILNGIEPTQNGRIDPSVVRMMQQEEALHD